MTGRPFPQAIETERALLGGLIRDPRHLEVIRGMLGSCDFYRPDHGHLFTLLLHMRDKGEDIDMVSLPEAIGRDGAEDRYGGVAYVASLPDHAPTTANLAHYAGLVKRKAVLRSFIENTEELISEAYRDPSEVDALIERATHTMFQLGAGADRQEWRGISGVLDQEIRRIEKLAQDPGRVTGVTTGFTDLDARLAGLQPTDLVILAARPAMGKTALALNIAQNAAIQGEVPVGVFSLEMSRGQLATRMLCSEARVDATRVRSGHLEEDDWDRLLEAEERLRRASIFLFDLPGLTLGEVRGAARRLKTREPALGLLVVDYLQLMQGDDPRASREQQISAISRGLKGLAKELQVPVLALSQLNRGVESRTNKRPMLSDLRESGAIEQDADVIMFIYRDEYYNDESEYPGIAEVIVAKQRQGPTGTVKLAFVGKHTRFDSLAPFDDYA